MTQVLPRIGDIKFVHSKDAKRKGVGIEMQVYWVSEEHVYLKPTPKYSGYKAVAVLTIKEYNEM